MPDDEPSFFDKERERLADQIASGFEVLLSTVNVLNRKLEEVHGMTKEYETIASLWSSFHHLMRAQGDPSDGLSLTHAPDHPPAGLPGTGGHVIAASLDSG